MSVYINFKASVTGDKIKELERKNRKQKQTITDEDSNKIKL